MTIHTHTVGTKIVTYTRPPVTLISVKTQSGAEAMLHAVERDEIVEQLKYYWEHNKESDQ